MNLKQLLFLSTILMLCSSCKLGRYVYYNKANITDYKIFDSREIEKADEAFIFPNAANTKAPTALTNHNGKEVTFESFLQENKTVAFLIIQNDSIYYEQYWDDYKKSSTVASFSMAKSVTSILIGCAIEDKLIGSVQEPVTKYIPELKENGFDKVTIEHLLQMTSGLDYNEGYSNPFGNVATFYYGTNLLKASTKLKLKSQPGLEYDYVSGNTQLLGIILDRVLGDRTISSYLQDKIWKNIGMEYDATWSIDSDKNGLEKTFCCINARAIDFAKIGRLYLNQGNWNGEQIINKEWVEQSTKVDTTNGSVAYYQYQWWLPSENGDFMARGILGEYIYVNPEKNMIIVRLGKDVGKTNWAAVFLSLSAAY